MNTTITAALLAVAAAAGVLCGWRGARPAQPLRHPRLIPWRALMLVFATMALAMAVHLATLLGVRSG